jgi:hypothetical protein
VDSKQSVTELRVGETQFEQRIQFQNGGHVLMNALPKMDFAEAL